MAKGRRYVIEGLPESARWATFDRQTDARVGETFERVAVAQRQTAEYNAQVQGHRPAGYASAMAKLDRLIEHGGEPVEFTPDEQRAIGEATPAQQSDLVWKALEVDRLNRERA